MFSWSSSAGFPLRSVPAEESERVSSGTVIWEINIARQNPALYATYVRELRWRCDGGFVVLPGGMNWRMKEGLGAIDQTVRFLGATRPEQPFTLSPGCVLPRPIIAPIRLVAGQDTAVATRVIPRIALAVTETGRDSGVKTLLTKKRLRARSFSRSSPTMGVQDGHIAKTFSIPILGTPGAAYGPHALYGSVCTINFASG